MTLAELDVMVKLVCPIHGLDSSGKVSFKEEATDEQKSAAQALVDLHLGDLDTEVP